MIRADDETPETNAVRRELRKAEATMVDLREWRVALESQTKRMNEARRALELHRLGGKGANQR